MKQKCISLLIKFLNALTHKRFVYVNTQAYHRHGRMAVQDRNDIWYVGNPYNQQDITYGIANQGLIEKPETELVELILGILSKQRRTITFLDIGANTGYYCHLAANKFGAQTHAFEPVPEFADCITAAALLNRTENTLHVHNIALSNTQGSAEITLAGSGSSLRAGFNNDQEHKKTTVLTDTLDTFIHNTPIQTIDFIKVDVEGFEYAVLQGAVTVVNEMKPIWFMEIARTMQDRGFTNNEFDATLDVFAQAEYDAYILVQNTLHHVNRSKIPDGVHMYLFIPRTQEAVKSEVEAAYEI